ncbi:hypothetical protein [Candidatus Harpocratesius sp.]
MSKKANQINIIIISFVILSAGIGLYSFLNISNFETIQSETTPWQLDVQVGNLQNLPSNYDEIEFESIQSEFYAEYPDLPNIEFSIDISGKYESEYTLESISIQFVGTTMHLWFDTSLFLLEYNSNFILTYNEQEYKIARMNFASSHVDSTEFNSETGDFDIRLIVWISYELPPEYTYEFDYNFYNYESAINVDSVEYEVLSEDYIDQIITVQFVYHFSYETAFNHYAVEYDSYYFKVGVIADPCEPLMLHGDFRIYVDGDLQLNKDIIIQDVQVSGFDTDEMTITTILEFYYNSNA